MEGGTKARNQKHKLISQGGISKGVYLQSGIPTELLLASLQPAASVCPMDCSPALTAPLQPPPPATQSALQTAPAPSPNLPSRVAREASPSIQSKQHGGGHERRTTRANYKGLFVNWLKESVGVVDGKVCDSLYQSFADSYSRWHPMPDFEGVDDFLHLPPEVQQRFKDLVEQEGYRLGGYDLSDSEGEGYGVARLGCNPMECESQMPPPPRAGCHNGGSQSQGRKPTPRPLQPSQQQHRRRSHSQAQHTGSGGK